MNSPILYHEVAEQAVLSAVFIDQHALFSVTALIDETHFFQYAHNRVFRAMLDLWERGETIDPITLSTHLDNRGDLATIGGKDFITYLIDVVPTAANAVYHAKIVRDLADRRAVVKTAETMIAKAHNRTVPVSAIAQDATLALMDTSVDDETSGYRSVKDMTFEVMQDLEDAHLGKAQGLSFGFRDLDAATGGAMPGELILIGSVPGAGKTAVAVNIALHAAERGEGVAIVSAEMKDRALLKRMISNRAQVNGSLMRMGKLQEDDFVRIGRTIGGWQTLPLWIDDTATPDIGLIIARIRQLKRKHPNLKWLVVDFLQLLGSARDAEEVRALVLTTISYALKGVAKELDLVVIATFQVDASGIEKRADKRPQLSDHRWSQGMREAADMMAVIYRAAMYEEDVPDTLEIAFKKVRDLAPFTAHLRWIGKFMRVEDIGPRVQSVQQTSLLSGAA